MTKKNNFEQAMSRLEELVNELESGEIQLDDMLKKYEEGAELIKICLARLDKAEKQIKKLSGNNEDGFQLDSFEV
jgi:exodeoxyribonuclease VII small subunit